MYSKVKRFVNLYAEPLIIKGEYHAQVQKHRKRVVFQGEARTKRAVFRVSKIAKIFHPLCSIVFLVPVGLLLLFL